MDSLSPDTETFSTPPTTPSTISQYPQPLIKDGQLLQHPGLTRKNSRPHSLTIDRRSDHWEGQPLVQVEQEPSPGRPTGTTPKYPSVQSNPSPTMQQYSASPAIPSRLRPSDATSPANAALMSQSSPLKQSYLGPQSPCFVHSHLDKGASLTDWLRNGGGRGANTRPMDAQAKEFKAKAPSSQSSTSSPTSSNSLGFIPSPSDYDEDDSEDGVGSLTRQLAATAVGVREMSKQLGRARVRSNIQNVMIITKARDNRLIQLTRDLALYLMMRRGENGRGLVVYVDSQLRTSKRFDAAGIQRDYPELFRPTPRRRSSSTFSVTSDTPTSPTGNNPSFHNGNNFADDGQLRYWTSDMCSKSPHLFDFVVTLGGDGTVLFTSWLFQRIVPPVLPFALGSLGFLTPFDFADYKEVMDTAIDSGIRVNLRMRFTCTVYRAVTAEKGTRRKAVKRGETGEILMKNIEKGGWEALEGGYNGPAGSGGASKCKDKEIMCFTTRPVESFEVINDLVVDRGPSPYVSLLELFGDEHHMTTVQADGLTVSTPTGSTAYSLSAGGSLVHPEIPAILITPICPHTLSFRPMLLPDTMELRICVPFNSRSTAWASFDGRGRVELKQGDHIKVTASQYPFPTVCADKQSTDWFHAIARTLKWNERERQKSFVVVEEGPEKPRPKKSKTSQQPVGMPLPEEGEGNLEDEEDEDDENEEDDEDEEDEEKFDIDDSSPEAAAAKAASTASTAEASANMKQNNHTNSDESNVKRVDWNVAPSSGNTKQRSPSENSADSESISNKSGITTPGRFRVDLPHPPKVHARHLVNSIDGYYTQDPQHRQSPQVSAQQSRRGVGNSPMVGSSNEPDLGSPRVESLLSESDSTPTNLGSLHYASPSLRTPRFDGGASLRTPRAVEPGSLHHQLMSPALNGNVRRMGGFSAPATPRNNPHHRRGKSYGDVPVPSRRAFAVYGQDESDSNASD